MDQDRMQQAAYLRGNGWTHISDLGGSTYGIPATWLHKGISEYQWWTLREAQVITEIIKLREENGADLPAQDEIDRILCVRDYYPNPEMIDDVGNTV